MATSPRTELDTPSRVRIKTLRLIGVPRKDLAAQFGRNVTTITRVAQGADRRTHRTGRPRAIDEELLQQLRNYIDSVSYTHLTLPTIYSV